MLDFNLLIDYQCWPRNSLIDDIDVEQFGHQFLARTVESWHLGSIDPDLAVVDLEPAKSRHDMLNHLDRSGSILDTGSPWDIDIVPWNDIDFGLACKITSNKTDPGIGRRGFDFDRCLETAPVPLS